MARHRLMMFLPLVIFLALVALFFVMQRQMGEGRYDPQSLPSALLNRPLPAFQLTQLDGSPITEAALTGRVALVNVWATWCPSCHYEHPYLNKLAEQGVIIFGIDYKDEPEKARQWLAEKGNPYVAVIDDRDGRLGLDLGVTGAPETYLVDHHGIVRFRYQGPIDERVWTETLQPLVQQLHEEQRQDQEALAS